MSFCNSIDWHGPGKLWVRTESGWRVKHLADDNENDQAEIPLATQYNTNVTIRNVPSNRSTYSDSIARHLSVQGLKGQRRVSGCLSDALQIFDMKRSCVCLPRFQYVYDLMTILLKDYLQRVSGTARCQLLVILEIMVNEAVQTEMNVKKMKDLVKITLLTLRDKSKQSGSGILWKRHTENVSNLQTKLDSFSFSQREEDGLPMLTDLPKECARGIMMMLSDPRDILSIGAASEDLYHISRDPFLWQRLTRYHYSKKQIMMYTPDMDYGEGVDWYDVFPHCYRKHGLKKSYTDTLVICMGCKSLMWRFQDHICYCNQGNENDVRYLQPLFFDLVDPEELVQIFRL